MVPASRTPPGIAYSAWPPSQTPQRGMTVPTMACGLLARLSDRQLVVDVTMETKNALFEHQTYSFKNYKI
jgi:hypothetical protein